MGAVEDASGLEYVMVEVQRQQHEEVYLILQMKPFLNTKYDLFGPSKISRRQNCYISFPSKL